MGKKYCHQIIIRSADLAQRVVKVSLFFYFIYLFIFYIILDVYNGLNLPFQLVGYSHLFCF